MRTGRWLIYIWPGFQFVPEFVDCLSRVMNLSGVGLPDGFGKRLQDGKPFQLALSW